jgi:hypothetical protein
MTAHYTGEIPQELVRAAFSENLKGAESEMGLRREYLKIMERPIGIEPTPEPWQGSVLPLY